MLLVSVAAAVRFQNCSTWQAVLLSAREPISHLQMSGMHAQDYGESISLVQEYNASALAAMQHE